jgi:predicted DsbA family dithiol-disulfide isomerase
LDWRGYELHPELPPGGRPIADLVGARRAAEYREHLDRFAANRDIPLNQPDRVPSSRRALRLTEYAREEGRLLRVKEAVMDAQWLEDRDIEANDVLGDIAERAGLSPEAALRAADSPDYQRRIDAIRQEALARKVISIPTFFCKDRRVVGCQPYEKLEKLISFDGRRSPRSRSTR